MFRKGKIRRWQGIVVTSGIAGLLLLGAFGAAALIYLVAEELLVEAIQAQQSLFSTAMLFAGFLVLIALKLFSQDKS